MTTPKLATILADIQRDLDRRARQLRFAAVLALNDTGKDVVAASKVSMQASLDRPRPTTSNSIWLERASVTGSLMRARVYASDVYFDANRVLSPHVYAGQRSIKGAERRFAAIGLMSGNRYMVPSAKTLADPKLTDQYGNVKGPFIRRLLSYFQAFTEAGFDGNMSEATRGKLAKRRRTESGFVRIDGVEYFISHGPGGRSNAKGKVNHLPAGIWSRRGIHGVDISPVFLFVRDPFYRQRWRFHEVAESTANRVFHTHLQRRLAAIR